MTGTPEELDAEWWQILDSVKEAHAAGVKVALGTDTNNPRVYPGYSVHRELETLVELGLTPHEALVAATRTPAEMLGREHDLGTIEVGKHADLIILEHNPLDDIRNTRSIYRVILDGRVFKN
jgi:imidazolonepropionase-like amidohydrolase